MYHRHYGDQRQRWETICFCYFWLLWMWREWYTIFVPMVARCLLTKKMQIPKFNSNDAKKETSLIISFLKQNPAEIENAFMESVKIINRSLTIHLQNTRSWICLLRTQNPAPPWGLRPEAVSPVLHPPIPSHNMPHTGYYFQRIGQNIERYSPSIITVLLCASFYVEKEKQYRKTNSMLPRAKSWPPESDVGENPSHGYRLAAQYSFR